MSRFPRKAYTVSEARQRMERYCAYQERCHRDVRQKLRDMQMIPEAADAIMVHLIEEGFLSEERFTRTFVRGKFRQKKWGKVRLKRELRQRGISTYLIDTALREEIPEQAYRETFEALARKRWDALQGEPAARRRQKAYTYLQYRGWENERIFDMLDRLSMEAGEDGSGD